MVMVGEWGMGNGEWGMGNLGIYNMEMGEMVMCSMDNNVD
jgi:hypothetical protein